MRPVSDQPKRPQAQHQPGEQEHSRGDAAGGLLGQQPPVALAIAAAGAKTARLPNVAPTAARAGTMNMSPSPTWARTAATSAAISASIYAASRTEQAAAKASQAWASCRSAEIASPSICSQPWTPTPRSPRASAAARK